MFMSQNDPSISPEVIQDHRRQWRHCLYVYPVISRRAGGLSIGVNLNPRRECTYSCVYCQIDRRTPRNLEAVDLELVREELALALRAAKTGDIWAEPRFADTPESMRRINDVAFSGDGEPTCLTQFDQAVQIAAQEKRRIGLDEIRIILITNATQLQSPQVERAIDILAVNQGQIWAKLDAGSEEYFRRVNRPQQGQTLEGITENIVFAAKRMPVVIQSLFMRLAGEEPSQDEIQAYIDRLERIVQAGAQIDHIQIHTIARSPAEPFVAYLTEESLRRIAQQVRESLDVQVRVYPGSDVKPIGS
jgi:wyosine [tRNA(Phe)-imidazoG37] synthetase (radical SAM superfamily)